jgi:hypothetical protein
MTSKRYAAKVLGDGRTQTVIALVGAVLANVVIAASVNCLMSAATVSG